MIRIISRDAVFSRMLCILFSGEARTAVSTHAESVYGGDVYLWDADSMGVPLFEIPHHFIVVSSDENISLPPETPLVFRPFKLDEFKKYVLEFLALGRDEKKELCFDDMSFSVSFDGTEVKFSKTEYMLLRKLYDADGELVSKEDAVSVFDSEESNVLEVYIYYLRKKLKKLPCKPEIVTVRGKGYILKKGDSI